MPIIDEHPLKFLDECPAWARKAGVKDLREWQFIEHLLPLDFDNRLATLDLVRRVLEYWDKMGE